MDEQSPGGHVSTHSYCDTHDSHQSPHALPACRYTLPAYPGLHSPRPVEGKPPNTAGLSLTTGTGPLQELLVTGNRVRNGSPPAERTAALSVTSDGLGPASSPAGQVSCAGPSRQEIPLHLDLTDLLVQPGDQGGIVSGLLFMTVADSALNKGLLSRLNLAGLDFVTDGQLGHCLRVLHRTQIHIALGGRAVPCVSFRHNPLLPHGNRYP